MNAITYKATSNKLNGHLLITYQDAALKSVEIAVNPALTPKQWFYLTNLITPELKDFSLEAFKKANLEINVLPKEQEAAEEPAEDAKRLPTNQRIAMFCQLYESELQLKYKVTGADSGKMKDLPINDADFEALVKLYFQSKEWYLMPKSIANFCGKINELMLLLKAPKVSKKYPIPYDPEYAANLNQTQLYDYWAQLKEAGYKYEAAPGRVGKWVKV